MRAFAVGVGLVPLGLVTIPDRFKAVTFTVLELLETTAFATVADAVAAMTGADGITVLADAVLLGAAATVWILLADEVLTADGVTPLWAVPVTVFVALTIVVFTDRRVVETTVPFAAAGLAVTTGFIVGAGGPAALPTVLVIRAFTAPLTAGLMKAQGVAGLVWVATAACPPADWRCVTTKAPRSAALTAF